MQTRSEAPARANRLAREKSPYLLQHQYNPVDWFPWGEEAFARAREEHKPVFLSIGYSTCHWCHVMERETFESEAVGRFLNEHFVSIKVDREERPDVDKIYMTFVQATTGQGGWPLSVFLTPERKPFFGGTYFPPEPRHGRPGFLQLVRHIADLWRERRGELEESAGNIHRQLEQFTAAAPGRAGAPLTPEQLRRAGERLKESYDPQHGGFGHAPKFPQPSHPRFLLRYAQRYGDEEARRMVLHTCDRMAMGGIHDQIGGGFARYAVDAAWRVPHFEKMLYDNAQLVQLYLDAHVVSGEPRHAEVVRGILDYVLRDLTHPEGGFFSAEDADSEGHEGKFYCWTKAELSALLAPDELDVAVRHFGLTEEGNFVDHSHPQPLSNQNVLSVADPALDERERALLASAKRKMFAARSRRIRPQRDDKVLASWNGLMLGALARAGAVLGEDRYRLAAERNVAFLRARLWDAEAGRLHHRWREGERDQAQLLDAYAFLLSGVLELYQTTLEPGHLEFAVALADALLARFLDREAGGFWQSAEPDLILRVKDEYDGAEPSGNSVALLALLELGHITGRREYREAAERGLRFFAGRMAQQPQAVPYMLQAADLFLSEPVRAVVSGPPAKAAGLLRAIHSAYQPGKVVLGTRGPVEAFARTLDGEVARVYLCRGTSCQPPATDPQKVRELLRGQPPG